MNEMESPAPTAADVVFLERCRQDLAAFFGPRDRVEEVVVMHTDDGLVELEARVVVSGRPATFTASGETVVDAYGHLRRVAPEQRMVLALRVLVDEIDAR
jgi:hypothetical protein